MTRAPGASDSISASGARMAPLEHFAIIVVIVFALRPCLHPGHDNDHSSEKEARFSQKETLRGLSEAIEAVSESKKPPLAARKTERGRERERE